MTRWLAAAVLLLGCDRDPSSAEEVADRFVDEYFVRTDQEAALRWSTGRARRVLQRELELVEGIRSSGYTPDQARPPIYATRGAVRREGDSKASVHYEVEIATEEALRRSVDVHVEKTGAGWRVASFRMREVR